MIYKRTGIIESWICWIVDEINSNEERHFNIAISGGRSVVRFLEKFENCLTLDGSETNLNIFVLDERDVDIQSNFSNSGLLLKHLKKLNIHTFNPHVDNMVDYCKLLKSKNYGYVGFDLIIAGFGEDGHIASLFEDVSVVQEVCNKKFIKVVRNDGTVRYTWSYDVIKNSKKICFLVDNDRRKVNMLEQGFSEIKHSALSRLVEYRKDIQFNVLCDE